MHIYAWAAQKYKVDCPSPNRLLCGREKRWIAKYNRMLSHLPFPFPVIFSPVAIHNTHIHPPQKPVIGYHTSYFGLANSQPEIYRQGTHNTTHALHYLRSSFQPVAVTLFNTSWDVLHRQKAAFYISSVDVRSLKSDTETMVKIQRIMQQVLCAQEDI